MQDSSRRRFVATAAGLGLGAITSAQLAHSARAVGDPRTALRPPRAVIRVGPVQQTGFAVSIDGSRSRGTNAKWETADIHGITRYAWRFGDGSPPVAGTYRNTVSHVFSRPGRYAITLTVTDHVGARNTTARTVVVGDLPRARVAGADGEAITDAIAALGGAPGIVLVPAGRYPVRSPIRVPAGVILRGAGWRRTMLVGRRGTDPVLAVVGNDVRVTGLWLQGPGRRDTGVDAYRQLNLRVDHCNVGGFRDGCSIARDSTATFETNLIHDQRTPGSGYGVMVTSGSYAMIRGNEMVRNRHHVAGNGDDDRLDNTGYDVVGNHLHTDNPAEAGAGLDMHASGHGRIRVVHNLFEDLAYAQQYMDGWGEIRNNTFRRVPGYLLRLGTPERGGQLIPGAGAHHLTFRDNTVDQRRGVVWLQHAEHVRINCRRVDDLVPYDGPLTWDDCD